MALKPDNTIARRSALLGMGALALAGCDTIIPGAREQPRLYRLTPKSTFPEGQPPVDWQLLVERPYAAASLNTLRIGLMTEPTRFDYYALANWTDQAPLMVQTLIVESFENSRRITAVGRDSVGLKPDFVLKVEMREFQVEAYSGAGLHSPHVGFSVKLVSMPDRLIVASTTIDRRGEGVGEVMNDIIVSWDDALGSAMKELVTWTLNAGEAAWRANDRRPRVQRGGAPDWR